MFIPLISGLLALAAVLALAASRGPSPFILTIVGGAILASIVLLQPMSRRGWRERIASALLSLPLVALAGHLGGFQPEPTILVASYITVLSIVALAAAEGLLYACGAVCLLALPFMGWALDEFFHIGGWLSRASPIWALDELARGTGTGLWGGLAFLVLCLLSRAHRHLTSSKPTPD